MWRKSVSRRGGIQIQMLQVMFTTEIELLGLILVTLLGAVPLQPQNSSPDSLVIAIAAVGDIMMGSTFPSPILPPNDGGELFSAVKSELSGSDIALGNLEGPLCNGGQTCKKVGNRHNYAFRSPTHYVKNLVDAGFDVLNLANNHIRDFGERGIQSTRQALDSAGIKYTGLIGDIVYLTVKGKKVSVIGFSPHSRTYSLLDIPKAQRIVADLKTRNNIVIVTFHGGSEGTRALHTKDRFEKLFGEPRGNVVRFSHSVIDSGADLVLGHGPHVPRALEVYKERLIAYSLGNFCTYGRIGLAGERGLSLILKVNLDSAGRFLDGRIIPTYQKHPGVPMPDSACRSIKLIKNLSQVDFPLTGPDISEDGLIKPKQRTVR
ncbi:MAG: CapA family protein [Candidatus Edwardsbacteria bacterium]